MIILARSPSVYKDFQSRLKGYATGWFLLDKVEFKVTCSPQFPRGGSEDDSDSPSGGTGDAMALGGGKFEVLKITKPVNGASPFFMHHACEGRRIPSLEIQVVETRVVRSGSGDHTTENVQNYPVYLMRFQSLWVTQWESNVEVGSMVETVELCYRRVACMYRRRDMRHNDGMNYESMGCKGWSIEDDDGNNIPGKDWDFEFQIRGDA